MHILNALNSTCVHFSDLNLPDLNSLWISSFIWSSRPSWCLFKFYFSCMGTCTDRIPTTDNIPETIEIFGWQLTIYPTTDYLKCLIWLKLALIYQNYDFFFFYRQYIVSRKKDSKKDLIEKKSYRPTTFCIASTNQVR